ncbi:MAG: hypothetical protein ACREI9_02425 [Nitrospiraceae bacterium]
MPISMSKTGGKREVIAQNPRKDKKPVKRTGLHAPQRAVDVLTCSEVQVEDILSQGEST